MAVEQTDLVVDEAMLEGYRALQEDGAPDVVTEFIDTFLADLPARLRGIELAVGAANPIPIRSATHALKGSAGTIGAARLSGLCAALETAVKAGQIDGAADLWTAIAAEAQRARTELLKFRDASVPLP